MSEQQDEQTSIGRRGLLRRASTVAAGIAGAGVVTAVAATPAQAVEGDTMHTGGPNDGGATTTTLTSASAEATLALANTKTTTDANGTVLASPALRLTPSGGQIADSAVGSLSMDTSGNIWAITGEYQGQKLPNIVHTTANSNQIVPLAPQRVVDTRSAAGRVRVIDPTGKFDSAGRLLAGKSISIDLSNYFYFADAVFGNVTVVPGGTGFIQVYPYNTTRPANFSTINFNANQILSNAFITGIGFNATYSDAVTVYANVTTHVIFDITAGVIGVGSVNPAVLPAGAAGARTASATPDRAVLAKQNKPSWK